MRSFYVLLLVMMSLSEVVFTTFYISLSQRLDAVPLVGTAIYMSTLGCLYCCYVKEKYQYRKKELLENLISP